VTAEGGKARPLLYAEVLGTGTVHTLTADAERPMTSNRTRSIGTIAYSNQGSNSSKFQNLSHFDLVFGKVREHPVIVAVAIDFTIQLLFVTFCSPVKFNNEVFVFRVGCFPLAFGRRQ
jgi:hypothetical protein